MYRFRLLSMVVLLCTITNMERIAFASDTSIVIDASKPGPRLSPLQHGIFYEEINHAGDGGLNAELIRNGNFADGQSGWGLEPNSKADATMRLESISGNSNRELVVKSAGTSGKQISIYNEGFFGIGVTQNTEFVLSLEARSETDKQALSAQ